MEILIADDHMVVRNGLKQLIQELYPEAIIQEAMDGQDAFQRILSQKFDLIVLDLSMPGINGMEILVKMQERSLNYPVLVLSMHPQLQYAIRVLRLGAAGYLTKDAAFGEIAEALNKIISGGRYISSLLAEHLALSLSADRDKLPHELLSEREFQIMQLLAGGLSVGEIAKHLCISVKTVSTHRLHLLEKMGLKRNAELTLYAISNDLVRNDLFK